jgi:hypothetical protein
MRKSLIIMSAVLLLGVSCDKSHIQQAQTSVISGDSELDREIRRVMEKGINLEERKGQVPAIATAFSLRTDSKRARWLAALCYLKTSAPLHADGLAEIALAGQEGTVCPPGNITERRGRGLAVDAPQVMSHGYSPDDMEDDEKCAEAAVRELASKLEMAQETWWVRSFTAGRA